MDRGSSQEDSDSTSTSTASSKSSTVSSRQDKSKSTQDFILAERGLDPYICGYLGRGKAGTPKESRGVAFVKFLDTSEKKCHAQSSISNHGIILSIEYSGILLADNEVETWKSQVVELFKNTDAVQSCKMKTLTSSKGN
ncbi:hypothetical protein CHS0354_014391 [Potamilus streckersoni]|uniref:Uncharacterized protein n=1 Tax=Potamilus streckersoni TaxID=2493646 RepID=A0AAE0VTC6_9BIVA|nr:hypothetical protein CHS0354_014391 [Potamilus streckersoni]